MEATFSQCGQRTGTYQDWSTTSDSDEDGSHSLASWLLGLPGVGPAAGINLEMGSLSLWDLIYPFLGLRSPFSNCVILLRNNPQCVGWCVAGWVYVGNVYRYEDSTCMCAWPSIGVGMYVFMGEYMKVGYI